MGDFNCNLNISSPITNYLTSMVHMAGLCVVPHGSTHHVNSSSTKIDLIIVNDLDNVLSYRQHSVSFLSNHDLINITLEFDKESFEINKQWILIRNLNNIPHDDFLLHLSTYDWVSIYNETNVNFKVTKLTTYLISAFDKYAPLHIIKNKKKFSMDDWWIEISD